MNVQADDLATSFLAVTKRDIPKVPALRGKTIVSLFFEDSTRTRLSFEAGMHQLGGAAIYLNTRDSQLGRGEPVEDAAQAGVVQTAERLAAQGFGPDDLARIHGPAGLAIGATGPAEIALSIAAQMTAAWRNALTP